MKASLQGISMQLSSIQINAQMVEGMQSVNKCMAAANKNMDVKAISDMIKEYQKQGMKSEMQQEHVSI